MVTATTASFEDGTLRVPLFKQLYSDPYLQSLNEQCAEELMASIKAHEISCDYQGTKAWA